MRELGKIYQAIKDALEGTGVKHVDLWNHNVEFIEQETAWETPAVFVEFRPIAWEGVKEVLYRGTVEVTLHIVTVWEGAESNELTWATADEVAGAVEGLSSDIFSGLRLTETQVNHNHEELVETLESYRCRVSRRIERQSNGI